MTTKKAPNPVAIPAVSMPAGSVDMDKFLSATADVEGIADPEKRDQKISKALQAALVRPEGASDDASLRPDQKLVEVEREDLGVTEQVRVHDAKSEAAREGEDAAAAAEAQDAAAANRQPPETQQEG